MSRQERDRGGNRDRDRDQRNQKPSRQSTFFINGSGIDREVITTDICRYLGNDALVRPGSHQDQNTGATQDGYYITAYRAPTSAQLQDLRNDSQKWQEEKRKNSSRGTMPTGGYDRSQVRAAIWGPSEDPLPSEPYPPQPSYSTQGQPTMASSRGGQPQPAARYGDQSQYNAPGQGGQPQPASAGGYRTDQYGGGASNYVYGQPNLATVTYQPERGGRPADPPRMMAPSNYQPPGPGAPPQPTYAGRGESSYSGYSPANNPNNAPSEYADPFYGRPGPPSSATFSSNTMEDDDSELYENEEMEFDPTPNPNQPPPPQPRSGRGHREDNPSAPSKRNRHGHH